MSYTQVNYLEVDDYSGMRLLREPLNAEYLGLTVIDEEESEGEAHNHEEEDHEEIYMLIEGDATIIVGGEDIEMEEGDAIRVDPETERKVHSEEGMIMVVAGAP